MSSTENVDPNETITTTEPIATNEPIATTEPTVTTENVDPNENTANTETIATDETIDPKKDISITPITVTRVTIIDKFIIRKVDVKLKESAEIVFDLVDNTGHYAGTKYLVISGEDYANWGSDDDYLINWIKNNLNV
jgi:hypothetical protein